MIVKRGIPNRPLNKKAVVAAIGIFDGVHLGHQAILRKAAQRARALGGTAAAVTFHPHPLTVLKPELVPAMLLSLDQRLHQFHACGITLAVVVPFTRALSRWKPEMFVRKLLAGALAAREVVVGHDFGFGSGRSGDIDTLRKLGRKYGFQVHAVPPVRVAGERISSRRIREMIANGNLAKAARLLGKPVTVVGRVIHGAGRGRQLGFPTANLRVVDGVLPPAGVYGVSVAIDGQQLAGMANIGFSPTFLKERKNLLLEVHLFMPNRLLYGRRLEVAFTGRLRAEKKFPSAARLADQLERDARRAKELFALQRPSGMV